MIVDTGADKVHAVVLNSEVEISKPEHQPGPRRGQRRDERQHEKAVDGKGIRNNEVLKKMIV